MSQLAEHLVSCGSSLPEADNGLWSQIAEDLQAGEGLEATLLKHPPSESLEVWISRNTSELLMPKEREVVSAVLRGERTLRLTAFLEKVLKPPAGLPVLTPNYDRLIEVACEMAGFHVDTAAIGIYGGTFDHTRSCMGSCRGIMKRAKTTILDHFPRAIVLKPHGSFDWYRFGNDARRCSLDLDAERLIITPGLNKYRAGYSAPFDKHRELANDYINRSTHLLIIGYGFNDDHLQTHLVRRIEEGIPTLILNRSLRSEVKALAEKSPRCVCLSKSSASTSGISMTTKACEVEYSGPDLWDLAVLTKELLV